LVQRVVVQGRPVSHVAKELGVSRQCAHRWLARFRAEGEVGLVDRSSRPHRCPRRTPIEVEAQVLELRRGQRRGQDWIGPELGVPARTVSAILRRHRVPYLRECDPLTGEVIRSSKATAVRYEHDRPGSLGHMDVKKVGKIPDQGGWRAHGRAAVSVNRNRQRRTAKVGFDYVHSLVDDYSRLAYCEVLPDETGDTCAGFLERALAYFAKHGIARIERLMTDNAWAYRHSLALREVCAVHQINQIFIRPHCPWQNGKVERFNRTIQIEWAYRQIFLSNTERTAALAPWLEYYNTGRRHSAIGGKPPISRLT
jgi:transposase InsO family protein